MKIFIEAPISPITHPSH